MNATAPTRILLALDGSVHAQRAAQYVARRAVRLGKSAVTVIHVIEGPPLPYAVSFDADPTVTEIRMQLQAAGVQTALYVIPGDPARDIARIANEEAYDEIVIGSRGAGAVEGLALGSVAYKLVHIARMPVTVVPNPHGAAGLETEDGESTHRVLLAVDGSKHAARAVEYACNLRQASVPVTVTLLNVQRPIASGQISRYIPAATIEAYLREEGEQALGPAASALRRAGVAFASRVRIGDVAECIVREAQAEGCTRIVMGTRGLGMLAGLALGSIALGVLHRSELPVTLVR